MIFASLSLQGHKKEIREREETVVDKDKRIYDLRKKNQELEKFKFVLNYKIQELKRQIMPRKKEIQVRLLLLLSTMSFDVHGSESWLCVWGALWPWSTTSVVHVMASVLPAPTPPPPARYPRQPLPEAGRKAFHASHPHPPSSLAAVYRCAHVNVLRIRLSDSLL